ncbi:MAG: hypothetical protein IT324_23505 [Anaerolineae bacterium]|nr:hypothetical protein [Anaerolineae bacterium]
MSKATNFHLNQSSFKIENQPYAIDGLRPSYITVPQFPEYQVTGFAITFDVKMFSFGIFPLYDLINETFALTNDNFPINRNLGMSLPGFLRQLKQESAEQNTSSAIKFCRFACNTVHTNFVRGNGFVIASIQKDANYPSLIRKPAEAVALDGTHHYSLETYDQKYMALAILPEPKLVDVKITHERISGFEIFDSYTNTALEDVDLAISGPAIVRDHKNVVPEIKVREKNEGQTIGNEINYIPSIPYQNAEAVPITKLPKGKRVLRTSFTAFGIESTSGDLIIASVFSGTPKVIGNDTDLFVPDKDGLQGITLYEMGELMKSLGASDAIVGGGSGDTQQYIYKRGIGNDIWVAQSRYQPGRPHIDEIRGLGTILTIHDL